MNAKNIAIGVLAALALLFGYLYFTASSGTVAGAASGPAHYQTESFLQGLRGGQRDQFAVDNTGKVTIGASGTAQTNFLFGTCNPTQTTAGSQAATTTSEFVCTVPGVLAGDKIVGDMPVGAANNPNGPKSPQGGFVLVSAYATTTGVIGFQIANLTGAASSSFPQATTTIEFFDWR